MERSASRVRLLGAALREGARKRLAAFRRKGPAEISLLPLVALIFFEVSGGPFGTEDAVSAGGGPLLALLGFAILPLVWSVPEALVTAELSTAFPDNSGYAGWVRRAFGDFWGFQEGWWSWISGVVDNAVYPVLFFSYCQSVFPWMHAPGWRLPILFGSTIIMTYLNWRGLKIVGKAVVALAAASLLPFLIFTCIALTKANPRNWTYIDKEKVNMGVLLNTLFWNLNYWDSISTLAGEVEKPEQTLPKALRYGVLLVVSVYFLPMLAGTGIGDPSDVHKWKEGYYSALGDQVGGKWLGIMILLAAIASSIGLFLAEMSSDSFQLQGMASDGQLPAIFARRSRYGTPTLAILLSASGIVTLVTFSFIEVVELLNFMYCLAELLEFGAFLTLRVKNPDAPRPFRVPLNTWGSALMLLPATLLLAFLMLQANTKTLLVCSVAVTLGFLLYPLLQYSKARGWCRFLDPEESALAHIERPLESEPPLEDLEGIDPEVTRELQEESTLLLPPEERSTSPT